MKRIISVILLTALLCVLTGCGSPDAIQLDLSQGFGEEIKLLHLNASTREKRDRIENFQDFLEQGAALDKDISLFAYYPDYKLEIRRKNEGDILSAVIDINGDYVDFILPESEHPQQIYRSSLSAEDFKKLVHRP